MKSYIRIKKSKQLRFKLVSVLILLFVSIAILNIPIEWHKENEQLNLMLSEYINKQSESDSLVQEIKKIKKKFKKNIQTIEISNTSNNYTKTNKFFIIDGNGKSIFQLLLQLNKEYKNDSLFQYLFQSDLKNGLENNHAQQWIEWKFKDTPEEIALLFMNELALKVIFLHDENEKQKTKSIEIKYSYIINELRVNEKMKYFIPINEGYEYKIFKDGNLYSQENITHDTITFHPKDPGNYEFEIQTTNRVHNFKIRVLPRQIFDISPEQFYSIYKNFSSKIKINPLKKDHRIQCSCDPEIKLLQNRKVFEFTPKETGWCYFTINDKNKIIHARDSLYVMPQPVPYLIADGVYDGKISASKISNNEGLQIKAVSLDKKNIEFTINKIYYTSIGKDYSYREQIGDKIFIEDNLLQDIQYIKIDSARISTDKVEHKVSNTLLIEVL